MCFFKGFLWVFMVFYVFFYGFSCVFMVSYGFSWDLSKIWEEISISCVELIEIVPI